jgi:predicted metal-dependent hydrolase
MEPQVLRVGDLNIQVQVSTRRRTAGLTVERDATITATVPADLDEARLVRFVQSKQQWLYARLRERAELGVPRAPREFVSGEGFPYLGRSYRLLLVDQAHAPVFLNHTSRRLELRRDNVDNAARHLARWYRQQGQEWLPPRAAPWAQRMDVEIAALRVRSLGYRWGSCTADGTVNIHWATMQVGPTLSITSWCTNSRICATTTTESASGGPSGVPCRTMLIAANASVASARNFGSQARPIHVTPS